MADRFFTAEPPGKLTTSKSFNNYMGILCPGTTDGVLIAIQVVGDPAPRSLSICCYGPCLGDSETEISMQGIYWWWGGGSWDSQLRKGEKKGGGIGTIWVVMQFQQSLSWFHRNFAVGMLFRVVQSWDEGNRPLKGPSMSTPWPIFECRHILKRDLVLGGAALLSWGWSCGQSSSSSISLQNRPFILGGGSGQHIMTSSKFLI